MNTNPWFLERMAEYERDRIQRDIQQIRLEKEPMRAGRVEEKANRTGLSLYGLLRLIVPIFVKWMFAWTGKFANPPKSKSEHQARDEQQIMVAEVSDCTSCGD